MFGNPFVQYVVNLMRMKKFNHKDMQEWITAMNDNDDLPYKKKFTQRYKLGVDDINVINMYEAHNRKPKMFMMPLSQSNGNSSSPSTALSSGPPSGGAPPGPPPSAGALLAPSAGALLAPSAGAPSGGGSGGSAAPHALPNHVPAPSGGGGGGGSAAVDHSPNPKPIDSGVGGAIGGAAVGGTHDNSVNLKSFTYTLPLHFFDYLGDNQILKKFHESIKTDKNQENTASKIIKLLRDKAQINSFEITDYKTEYENNLALRSRQIWTQIFSDINKFYNDYFINIPDSKNNRQHEIEFRMKNLRAIDNSRININKNKLMNIIHPLIDALNIHAGTIDPNVYRLKYIKYKNKYLALKKQME